MNQLHKDKLTLSKNVEGSTAQQKENDLKIEMLNKQIIKKNRQIKEFSFKID